MQLVLAKGLKLIDCVVDGKTIYEKVSAEEALAKDPELRLIPMDQFCSEVGKVQDEPVKWSSIEDDDYYEKMNCLPPALTQSYGFLLGEPQDHHFVSGKPRFAAFLRLGTGNLARFLRSSRPLTASEFVQLDISRV